MVTLACGLVDVLYSVVLLYSVNTNADYIVSQFAACAVGHIGSSLLGDVCKQVMKNAYYAVPKKVTATGEKLPK